MSGELIDTLQQLIRRELGRLRTAEIGMVEGIHPHASDDDTDNYACSIRLRDSGISLPNVPLAAVKTGIAAIPAEGDVVLVQFVNGDIHRPVIIGSLYTDQQRPPVSDDGTMVLHLPHDAADDDAVHLELCSVDKREFSMALGAGLVMTLRDDDPAIEFDVGGGKCTISVATDGAVTLESQGGLTLKGNEITMEAQGNMTLKGAKIDLNP
jgi:phage baseplate assembly protein gpV